MSHLSAILTEAEQEAPSRTDEALARPPSAAARPLPLPSWLSLELTLYSLVFLLGAGLRLVGLGEQVLSPAEGERALAAWNAFRGREMELWHGPTLVYGVGSLLFLFGANDATARVLPAIAGIWLVIWPFFLRKELGRTTALAAGLVIATSPSLVYASRLVSGEMLVLALISVVVLGVARYRRGGGYAYLAISGIAGGLTLAAGPAAYAFLVPLALCAGVWRLLSHGRRALPHSRAWRLFGACALGATVVVATGVWSSPSGVQRGLIDAAAAWTGGPGVPWHYYLTGTILYELPSLGLGLLAVALGGRRVGLVGAGLVLAWCAGLVYSLAGVGRPEALALVAAPLAVAGGLGLARLWETTAARAGVREVALFLALTLPSVGLLGTVMGYALQPSPVISPLFLLAPALYLALVTSAWAYWRGTGLAVRGVLALVVSVLVLSALHSSTLLAFSARTEPAEPLAAESVSRDVRNLLREVEDHTAVWAVPRRRDLPVAVAEPFRHPLAWYLREYPNATFGELEGKPTLVITTPDIKPPSGEYQYQRYVWQSASEYPPEGASQLWRWLIYREPSGVVVRHDAHLYVAVSGRN